MTAVQDSSESSTKNCIEKKVITAVQMDVRTVMTDVQDRVPSAVRDSAHSCTGCTGQDVGKTAVQDRDDSYCKNSAHSYTGRSRDSCTGQ